MAKLRFIVVGSGWRSLFYWRIAQALPERFELCAMLCRTEEKAEKMHREYGVPVSTSAEQCIALHPDLVVVAVNKASIAAVSTEWLGRGFAVLCETPAALEEDALRALWQLHQQGAKLQVAEQYWLYPTLAKRLAAVRSGALGTPQFARLSVAHGYHAVSCGFATQADVDTIKAMAFKVNDVLKEYFASIGVELIDFKLEFGKTADGQIVLADEISPDTCRFWDIKTHEKLDKDRFRRDLGGVEDAYKEMMKRVGLD